MTLEQLLDCSADQLEALSDSELTQILAPKFPQTRPEFAGKVVPKSVKLQKSKSSEELEKDSKKREAMRLAKSMGIDLGNLI